MTLLAVKIPILGIDADIAAERKYETWKLVPHAEEKNVITSKWILKVREMPDPLRCLETPKARLVAGCL